jgi:hypothetical protein
MFLISTLIPALIIVFVLQVTVLIAIRDWRLQLFIVLAVGIGCMATGTMHLVLIGILEICVGALWIYIHSRMVADGAGV